MAKKDFDSFIFTHIPKCGGTSFRSLINTTALANGIHKGQIHIPGFNTLDFKMNFDQLNEDQLLHMQSQELKVIACHCKFDMHKTYNLTTKKPFYFTILRDPIDRFISHYNFFYFKLGYNDCKGVSLNELTKKKLDFLLTHLGNIQTRYLSSINHIKLIGFANVLKVAKYNLQYEYHDFGLLNDTAGMIQSLKSTLPEWLTLGEIEMPISNAFKHQDKLSPKLIRKIKAANKYDVELYKFAKMLHSLKTQFSESKFIKIEK